MLSLQIFGTGCYCRHYVSKNPLRLQKVLLTLHVASSVGWFGAVLAFPVLAVIGLRSEDTLKMTTAYVAMGMLGRGLILPLSLVSVSTGILQGVIFAWGLLRYYWVAIKLIVTVLATLLLLVHLRPIDRAAAAAAQSTLETPELRHIRTQLVGDSGLALAVLALTTALSVFKPGGLTPRGRRQAVAAPAR